MNHHLNDFMDILKSFNKYNVEYILIGGVAVILHGLERMTADLDIMIKMTADNIHNLRNALLDVFNDSSIEEITVEELSEYPVIRYGTPNDFYIDIMTHIGEAAAYDDLEYEIIDCSGIPIHIATPETLFRLKRDTVRHKDKVDAIFLDELIQYRKGRI